MVTILVLPPGLAVRQIDIVFSKIPRHDVSPPNTERQMADHDKE
jgi:hypothetical protein